MAYHDDRLDVRRLAPHQLGWLRRPELDTPTADVWERPDGALLAQAKGKALVFEHLANWRELQNQYATQTDAKPVRRP